MEEEGIFLVNWNPHSLLQISPTPTPLPSTQLALVYTSYVYPPREEERDSKMDGFKLDIFNREAGINRSTGELLLHDWSSTKSCLEPDSAVSNTWGTKYVTVFNTWALKDTVTSYFTNCTLCSGEFLFGWLFAKIPFYLF